MKLKLDRLISFSVALVGVVLMTSPPSWAAEDWTSALAGDAGDVAIWTEASRAGELPGLIDALNQLDGDVAQRRATLLGGLIPGGDLASAVSSEQQALLIGAWAKGISSPRSGAYRLWRISQLSPEKGIREAAAAAVAGLPKEMVPEGVAAAVAAAAAAGGSEIDPAVMERGKEIYMRPGICFTCHQPNGLGIPLAFPPLAGSEWLDGDVERQAKIVVKGLIGEIEVKGEAYNSAMAPLELMLNDQEVADVLTYVNNAWGNSGPLVTADEVKAVRAATVDQKLPYQVGDLLKDHPLGK